MTIRHIAHSLTCPECRDARLRDPPEPPRGGQCTLALDDGNPPALCPHPREAGSEWCDIHTEAILEAQARAQAEELAETVAMAERAIAGWRDLLREHDERIQQLRELGTSDTEMLPHRLGRERMASRIEDMLAKKQAAEAWLADAGWQPPGGDL